MECTQDILIEIIQYCPWKMFHQWFLLNRYFYILMTMNSAVWKHVTFHLLPKHYHVLQSLAALPVHRVCHLFSVCEQHWKIDDTWCLHAVGQWFTQLQSISLVLLSDEEINEFSAAQCNAFLLPDSVRPHFHSTLRNLSLNFMGFSMVSKQLFTCLVPQMYPLLRKLKLTLSWSCVDTEYFRSLVQLTQLETVNLALLGEEPASAAMDARFGREFYRPLWQNHTQLNWKQLSLDRFPCKAAIVARVCESWQSCSISFGTSITEMQDQSDRLHSQVLDKIRIIHQLNTLRPLNGILYYSPEIETERNFRAFIPFGTSCIQRITITAYPERWLLPKHDCWLALSLCVNLNILVIICTNAGRIVPEYIALLQPMYQQMDVFRLKNINVTINELNALNHIISQMPKLTYKTLEQVNIIFEQ